MYDKDTNNEKQISLQKCLLEAYFVTYPVARLLLICLPCIYIQFPFKYLRAHII